MITPDTNTCKEVMRRLQDGGCDGLKTASELVDWLIAYIDTLKAEIDALKARNIVLEQAAEEFRGYIPFLQGHGFNVGTVTGFSTDTMDREIIAQRDGVVLNAMIGALEDQQPCMMDDCADHGRCDTNKPAQTAGLGERRTREWLKGAT